jgi:putative intracellular protease/amidase
MAKKVIVPLPDKDFDTTEVSIPWKHFIEAGLQVTFSTQTGHVGQTDPRLLTGVIFGQLGAKPDAIAAYRELEKNEEFRHPSGSMRKPFVVEDGNLITARYPQDAHLFAQKLLDRIKMDT